MDPNYFDEMSAWDKLVTLYSGAWPEVKYGFSSPINALHHIAYPTQLRESLKTTAPEIGIKRTDRSALDRAINYGGGYQFGRDSGMSYDDSEKMAKSYQLKQYLKDKYLYDAPESRLKDASMDYYENVAGLKQAYQDSTNKSKPEDITKLSAMYAKDFTQLYNTPLSEEEEKNFQFWAKKNNKLKDLYDYDLRGAWKKGVVGKAGEHSPDTYKKPNHPTFSNESVYNKQDNYTGGQWSMQDNKNTYTPDKSNMYSKKDLYKYFKEREPNVILNDFQKR